MGILTVVFLAIVSALLVGRQTAPSYSNSSDPAEFSVSLAMEKLRAISERPRPIGSPAHEHVRSLIVEELQSLGVAVEVQRATSARANAAGHVAATVHNIVGRVNGEGGTDRAILLVGHYDTVPNAPGAADDGAAIALMIETLRALKAGPALRNDLILLFSDAEEPGLLGAATFVKGHSLANQVALVFNFEARGSHGPSLMFETSDENGWLVSEYAKAATAPYANSAFYEIYRRLPNDTDFTVFKRAGFQGLNFAFIDGSIHYHTALDNFDSISERSLEHQGRNCLSLVRHFGNLRLEGARRPNYVYFDLLGLVLVRYPGWLVLPLSAIAVVCLAAAALIGFRRRVLSLSGCALGAIALVSSTVGAALFIPLVWSLVRSLHSEYQSLPMATPYGNNLYALALALLTVLLALLIHLPVQKRVGVHNLTFGSLLCWTALLAPVSFLMPGVSYLIVWPLLFSTIGLITMVLSGKAGASRPTSFGVLSALAVPTLTLVVPLIYWLFVALTINSSGAAVATAALVVGLLTPQLSTVGRPNTWWFPAFLTASSLGLFIAGSLTGGFDKEHPRVNSMVYALNGNTGEAFWVSPDQGRDEWTSQFLGAGATREPQSGFFRLRSNRLWKAPAEAVPHSPPEVKVLENKTDEAVKTLHLVVSSPRGAPILAVYLDSSVEVLQAALNGERLDMTKVGRSHSAPWWSLRYHGVPPEGIELKLQLGSAEPVNMRFVDQSYGFSDEILRGFQPRPDYMIPSQIDVTDCVFVSRSERL